ncbi:WxL protein peptidoglycan domain-containing protein [Streptomyces sp. NPDC053541]|uniref:WxL protein peptidoglycan domain-containing protein n=1 Tax=Streptomyces sp. NPDC053541 TaxID=3365709 RepID=UPI0037D57E66
MTKGPAPVRTPYALLRHVLALLGALLLLGAQEAPAASAADNGEWAVYPAASQLGSRPYFYLSADPGATVTDRVTVANKTAAPLTFLLYGADAYNTERDGGFAVRTRQEQQTGTGAWIRPARDRVTVPARSAVTVPYTLTVPATAEPGDHAGALVALDERIARAGTGRDAVALGVQRAVAARVYLRVGGPTVPALSVEDVTLVQHRPLVPGTRTSRAVVSYTLHNRGNVTLDPRVALRAEGAFGRTLLTRDLGRLPAALLPRQKIRLTAEWTGSPQLDWGDVTLTATAEDVRASGRAGFLALPWLPLAVLLTGTAGGALALRLRRRRSARGDAST